MQPPPLFSSHLGFLDKDKRFAANYTSDRTPIEQATAMGWSCRLCPYLLLILAWNFGVWTTEKSFWAASAFLFSLYPAFLNDRCFWKKKKEMGWTTKFGQFATGLSEKKKLGLDTAYRYWASLPSLFFFYPFPFPFLPVFTSPRQGYHILLFLPWHCQSVQLTSFVEVGEGDGFGHMFWGGKLALGWHQKGKR